MDTLLQALQVAAALYASDEKASALEAEKPWMSRPLPRPIIEATIEAIAATPDILELTRLRQLSLGSSESRPLYPVLLASALVKRTHALGNSGQAIHELLELVAANSGYARVVMVLAGVQTSESTELAPGIQIVPFGELQPPSWIKDFTDKRLWPLSRTFESVAPSAVLVTRVPFTPLFTTQDKVEGDFPEKEIAQLRTVAHCIALAAERPTAILKVWYEDDDLRLPLATSGVLYSDPRWGSGAAAPYAIDPGRVRAIVASYQRFRGKLGAVETALTRLAGAWGGWHREERAIDLGIALAGCGKRACLTRL